MYVVYFLLAMTKDTFKEQNTAMTSSGVTEHFCFSKGLRSLF